MILIVGCNRISKRGAVRNKNKNQNRGEKRNECVEL